MTATVSGQIAGTSEDSSAQVPPVPLSQMVLRLSRSLSRSFALSLHLYLSSPFSFSVSYTRAHARAQVALTLNGRECAAQRTQLNRAFRANLWTGLLDLTWAAGRT